VRQNDAICGWGFIGNDAMNIQIIPADAKVFFTVCHRGGDNLLHGPAAAFGSEFQQSISASVDVFSRTRSMTRRTFWAEMGYERAWAKISCAWLTALPDFLLSHMTTEGTCRGEFTQAVTHHILGNIDGYMPATIMNSNRVTHHLGKNHAGAAPGANDLFSPRSFMFQFSSAVSGR
jgi:hypothetical protein